MNKEEASTIARNAVTALIADRGLDAKFTFDEIWGYADASNPVPSTMRPSRAQELIKASYIERTGAMVHATAPTRAGNLTSEYRPGPRFRASQNIPNANTQDTAAALKALENALLANGFVITTAELANFYLALASSPLVILAGISGTGKSRLPRLFAHLTNSRFRSIPVKPQWSDNSDLFGYTPSLAPEQFIIGAFTNELLRASEEPDTLSLVLLDEMNLAAVEHYFSDFLSVIETRRKIQGKIITDPLPLELPPLQTPDPHASLRGLCVPHNTRVIGTANMDETTRAFSPKVLDRAFSLEFDDPDLTIFASVAALPGETTSWPGLARQLLDAAHPISVDEVYSTNSTLFDGIAALLEEVKGILKPAGISFGYRPRNDICLYMYFWTKFELAVALSPTAAMDFCFLQKILPKINGTGEALDSALRELLVWLRTDQQNSAGLDPCASRPWERSAEKVQRMINRLEVESATTYWGT